MIIAAGIYWGAVDTDRSAHVALNYFSFSFLFILLFFHKWLFLFFLFYYFPHSATSIDRLKIFFIYIINAYASLCISTLWIFSPRQTPAYWVWYTICYQTERQGSLYIYIYIMIRHDRLGCAGLSNITQLILARSNISSQYLAKVHGLW